MSFALGIVLVVVQGNGPAKSTAEIAPPTAADTSAAAQVTPAPTPTPEATPAPAATPAAVPAPASISTLSALPATVVAPASKLVARPSGVAVTTPATLGSLDAAKDRFCIEFAENGAGISRIVFSEFWTKAVDREAALRHAAAVAAKSPTIPPLPPASDRYTLSATGKLADLVTLARFTVPMLCAHSIDVDGQVTLLFGKVWSEVAPGSFETMLADDAGTPVLRIRRSFAVRSSEGAGYDIVLTQSVDNLSTVARRVRMVQYGPSDLTTRANEMMDIRRLQFGYLMSERRDPAQSSVITHDAMLERAEVVKNVTAGKHDVWPSVEQKEQDQHLSWFGTTNRYFALAVHAPMVGTTSATPNKSLAGAVEFIRASIGDPSATDASGEATLFTELHSPAREVAAGQSADFSMGVFAGPLKHAVLANDRPYSLLEMSGLIVYSMGGCCSWCTFAWLANLMVIFLDFLHDYLVFDWGIAIVVLVLVVRLILHPVSKKSQVQMQRVTRGLSEMKPEIEALKARYGDDPKRMQQEQMRLYKEKGINPLGCAGGFLPTFLQMPIWMALYAVLYLAFELRQQPAFFGFFQLFGGWEFLGDLSAQDRFIPLPTSINLYIFTLTSINLLPLLMGAVFYVQQKYMAPPPSTKMTPEQEQQQKMMRVMTVVMFPVMLYAAPSGLTLYIMTSTLVGIWESKMVRRHIEEIAKNPVVAKKSKTRDAIGRMYERAMARAQEKRKSSKTFKDRG
ncbi:MAG: membrane protein insertase YidC [Phycisphaerales bacterium]|nr:membrane protein insertase YidC [Phycisphaerales bacterium]